MKNVLIASFDMEVGGVERSLISMLNNFDYDNYQVDLMLYSHTGDFMDQLPKKVKLLKESKAYKTFRMPIKEIFKTGNVPVALSRLMAKIKTSKDKTLESGYKQMQYMWKYALPFLPRTQKEYDVAISYLWPHYFVAEKVEATTKIAWIHTDYSTIKTDIKMDLEMWKKFDYIVAVSEECKNSFLKKYKELKEKLVVIENITSPDFIRESANELIINPMTKDQRFKIITVARLSYAKGIDNAIKALKILNDKGHQNIAWYVVGYGGDEGKLKKMISENNLEENFILLGKRTNPYPYIKECDLYIQPSRYEGKAVTVGEAQILCKPVLITDYNTAKSQVKNNFDGYITEQSVEGIAKGIEKLIFDEKLRQKIVNNCIITSYGNESELLKLYPLFCNGSD
ncbi:glycosyltransferase [Sediminibacillus massiliensis]|uniref:glycosyltransferase n=1 Tax=Sediminibacillus massiliensis TaxID=1926277 RepID=UPI000988327F|nr:glycosyltransferase [Sediminibacillus massiliensis]